MKILVIGELCEDRFIYGESKRLSPEAPVPIFIPQHTKTNPGMGGNVTQNILSISPGSEVRHLHQNDIIKKTRYVDEKSNHMFLRVDEGDGNVDSFIRTKEIDEEIRNADAVIVSDYNKGFLDEEDLRTISLLAKFSILDTKKIISTKHYSIYGHFNFIKLNEDETRKNEFNKLTYPPKNLITTLGARGAMYDNIVYPSPAPLQTMDVSGAGDTFIAAFTVSYMSGNDVIEAIKYANEMCSIVVGKRGVAVPINR